MIKKLPTIDIKGKDYVMVKDRILAFQELYPNGSITTEKFIDGDIIVFKATVIPNVSDSPIRTFTGHSEAIRGRSMGITGQSPVEVSETSAVGRALAMLGIGIIESVASADEVKKASYVVDKIQAGKNFTADEFEEAQAVLPDELFEATKLANKAWHENNPARLRNPGVKYGKIATGGRLLDTLKKMPTVDYNDLD